MTTTEAPPGESNRRATQVTESIAEAMGVPIVDATEIDQEQPESCSGFGTLRVRLIPEALDTVPVITGPFQVMPPPTLDEYRALVESIAANGVRVPVLKTPEDEGDETIDGHYGNTSRNCLASTAR